MIEANDDKGADTEQAFQIQNEIKQNLNQNSKQKQIQTERYEAEQSSISLTNRYEDLSTDDEQSLETLW